MMDNIPLIAAGAGVVGLLIAFYLYSQVKKVKIDNEVVADITDEIQKGAMAFLFAEYRILSIFVIVVGAVLAYLNDIDTAIAIRTAVIKDQLMHVGAGAGIVADSDPEKEWLECIQKSQVFIDAMEMIS